MSRGILGVLVVAFGLVGCGSEITGDPTDPQLSETRKGLAPTLWLDQAPRGAGWVTSPPELEYVTLRGENYPNAKWLLGCLENTVPGMEVQPGYTRLCGPWYSGKTGTLAQTIPAFPGDYFVTVDILKSYSDTSGTLAASGYFTVVDTLP